MSLQGLLRSKFQLKTLLRKQVCTNFASPKTFFVEPLISRALLRIRGDEVEDYVQGLITNDINHFHGMSRCLYTLFLNSKGRVLYDTIIYKTNETNSFFIECDSSASDSLKKHLLTYRVRRKISVDSVEDLAVWVVCNNAVDSEPNHGWDARNIADSLQSLLPNCSAYNDPRIIDLGVRILAPKEVNLMQTLKNVSNFQQAPKHFYKSLRYKLGVGEGVNELLPGQSLPLEVNCDYLHGISFHKGCYIGQELTARTYHTGVIRKRLMPISFDESLNLSETLDVPVVADNNKEKPIGKVRGIEGNVGIALLRIAEALKTSNLRVLGKLSKTRLPPWWPLEAQKEHIKAS